MDSNDTKQIIISFHAIENAIDAMLKPVKTELGDSEAVGKMPKDTYDTLHWMKMDCKSIQNIISRMADYIGDLEESVYDDGEITQSGKMINDILLDVQPIPSQPALDEIADGLPLEKTNLVEFANKLAAGVRF